MRTLKIKTLATGIVASALLVFTSCKKGDTGDTGAAGTPGTNGVVAASSDGFIKGTISGTRQDGTAFNETFEYKNYYSGPSARLDSNNATSFDFNIDRQVDVFGTNSASITVNTTSKTATSGNISLNNFNFTKTLSTHKEFDFSTNTNLTATITGLTYNQSTGLFTGSYSFNVLGFQNSTGNTATISGSFEATMTQIYNLVKHTDAVITQ